MNLNYSSEGDRRSSYTDINGIGIEYYTLFEDGSSLYQGSSKSIDVDLATYSEDFNAKVSATDYLGHVSSEGSLNILRDIEAPDYNVSYKVEPAGQTNSYIVTTFLTDIKDDDVSGNGDGDNEDGSQFSQLNTRLYFTLGENIKDASTINESPENIYEGDIGGLDVIGLLDDPDASAPKDLATTPQIGFAEYFDENGIKVDNTYYLKFIVEANTELETTLVVADNVANAAIEDIIYNIPGQPAVEMTEDFETKIVSDCPGLPYLDLYLKLPTSYDAAQSFSSLDFTIALKKDLTRQSFLDIMAPDDLWIEDFVLADPKFKIAHYNIPLFDEPREVYETSGNFSFSYIEETSDGTQNEKLYSGTFGELELTAPNIPLSENNQFALSITRNNSDLTDQITYEDLNNEKTREIFFNEEMTLALNETEDREGDELRIGYIVAGETEIHYTTPDLNGNHILEISSGLSELSIEENFIENDSFHNNIFNVLLVKDEEINENTFELLIKGNEVEPQEYPISSNGEFTAVFTEYTEPGILEKPIDRSGFNSAIIFDADTFNFDLSDEDLATAWASYDKSTSVDFLNDGTDTGTFAFETQENNEVFHHLGIRIEDNAGNVKFFHKKVVVDTKAPSLFIVGLDSVIMEKDTTIVYSFDPVNSQIHLIPHSPDSGYLELIRDQNSYLFDNPPVLSEYRLDWRPLNNQTLTKDDSNKAGIITLDNQYISNKYFSVELTITDFVGNSSIQTLHYYNPVKLGDDINRYLLPTDLEWNSNDKYHYFSWDEVSEGAADLSEYNLYRDYGNETRICENLIDTDLLPHEKADYLLFGVNGSGYESTHEGSYIPFSRVVKNNQPQWENVLIENDHTDTNGKSYTGPFTIFNLLSTEADGDRLELNTYVNGSIWDSRDLSNSGFDVVSMEDLRADIEQWENNIDYNVVFTLTDYWTDHEGTLKTGNSIQLPMMFFTYDNEGPNLADFFMETREDYNYGYGDLLVSLTDNQSGNDNQNSFFTASNGSDLVAEVLEENSDYTHRISGLDDGTNMTIVLNLVDNLGNSSSFPQSGLNKDSVSPGINDLNSDELIWNDQYLNNTGVMPLTINWQDDRSGIADAAYRLKLNDEIVYESSIDSLESPMSSTSGIWNVSPSFKIMPKEEDSYTLEARVVDHAGNPGEWVELNRKIRFDYFAPSISISPAGGWVIQKGSVFFNGTAPIVESSSSDGTEIVNTWYSLETQDLVGIPVVLNTLDNLAANIVNGNNYELYMWAEDAAGNRGKSQALAFSSDTQAPEIGSLNFAFIDTQESYASGEAVRFSVSMEDGGSGVDDYYVAIGQDVSGTFAPLLTENVTGRTEEGYIK
ncbi:MAG: Ig-like domain repeat protein, partial [Spirochaetaceae bacterium]|nr:Ig-like domain repeat protein [Spirochaetaceae bacterium]